MDSPLTTETIPDLLTLLADTHPDRPALICPERGSLSYRDLTAQVRNLSRQLISAPSEDGPYRIAIVIPNGPEMSIGLLAVTCVGIAAPLNPSYTRFEFERYYQSLGVDAVLLHNESPPAAREAAKNLSIQLIECTGSFPEAPRIQGPSAPSPAVPADQTAMVLLTSGSSGEPKRVPLTHRNILSCLPQICQSLALTPDDRVLSMWEQFHVGGLIDLLLAPLSAGSSIICTDGFDVHNFYTLLEQQTPTWFQAVPATLNEIMAYARNQKRERVESEMRFIRSVAAALPETLQNDIEKTFGLPVIQTFGMTEASPLITTTELPPATRIPQSVGRSFGTDIAVFDSKGNEIADEEVGELAIRGPNVMTGYENDPEANQAAFRNGWFFTGDLGYRDAQGYVYLKGRVRELINRGGEKISPQEVDEVFSAHPAIQQAACYATPHPVLGEDIALAVVLNPGFSLDPGELKSFAADHLSSFKIPRHITATDSLPKGDTGKLLRRKLSELFPTPERPDYVAPRTVIEKKIVFLWQSALQVTPIGIDDDFFDLGGDSLSAVRMLDTLKQRLGVNVELTSNTEFSTIRKLMDNLKKSVKESPPSFQSPSLSTEEMESVRMVIMASGIPIAPTNGIVVSANPETHSSPPLIWCFNGLRKEMRPLVDAFGTTRTVYGLYSGGGHLPDTVDMNSRLAQHYLAEINALVPKGPLHLGGNCRGAHVMSHLAILCHQAGREIASITLVDFFQPVVQQIPQPFHLLLGRESLFRVYRDFKWKQPGWKNLFITPPSVSWVDGGHGDYFKDDHLPSLVHSLSCILEGNSIAEQPSDAFRPLKHRIHDMSQRFLCKLASLRRKS